MYKKTKSCKICGSEKLIPHPDAISFLRVTFLSLRCIGMDTISISPYQNRELGRIAHKTAMEDKENGYSQPLLILDGLNLKPILEGKKIGALKVCPWLIQGVDSPPCTAIIEVDV